MRQFMTLVETNEYPVDKTHFANESEVTESDLRHLFNLVWNMAAKNKDFSLGATLVYALQGDDRYVYFNDVVCPLYVEMGLPIQGKPGFEKFEDELKRRWFEVKRRPDDGDLNAIPPLQLARERLGF